MRLRRQLVLVSLVILALPWAGCQSIRQMESALREAQGDVLLASAQAIAARLQSETDLITAQIASGVQFAEQQLFIHPLAGTPLVDGYGDDWSALPIEPRYFEHPERSDFHMDVWLGRHGTFIYWFSRVSDNSPVYHDLGGGRIATGDHLILRTLRASQDVQSYYLRTTGPGSLTASYINNAGAIRQEHRIRGEWRETPGGYDIEMRIPLSVIGETLDFSMVNVGAASRALAIGTHVDNELPPPWVSVQSELEDLLQPFARKGMRIGVVNWQQWLVAQAGRFNPEDAGISSPQSSPDLRQWVYCLALGGAQFPVLDNPRYRGRMDTAEVTAALAGTPTVSWYQTTPLRAWYQCLSERIGRAAVPVAIGGDAIGAVVVEQSTGSLSGATNAAFSRLFYYTLFTVVVVGIALFAYASWLSLRIRRLSRAADDAIGDDGKIRPAFLQSKAKDEIGDLTRSYGQLLSRLRDYTEYLRTLASKLSHELRTPLAVVRSSLENLEQQQQDAHSVEYAQRAKEGADRLANILNAMSAANRVEESIQHTQLEAFNLDRLVEEVSAAYRGAYPHVEINAAIDRSAGSYRIEGSPDLIVQMLDKLVDNAADFCPPGGKITLALRREKNSLLLAVRNTGPLLPEQMQGQLFDSLVSVREGPKHGTHLGLGLYIVRLIVDFHGGKVNAQNLGDGSGVEFSIRLPVFFD